MQIVGTNVIAPVVPLDTTDTHPSHEARYGRGGYRSVTTIAERDAIPLPRREAGMLVYVSSDLTMWQLANDLTTWRSFTASSGGGGGLATLAGAADVSIDDPQTGDFLRYQTGFWRNEEPETVVDGGAF